MSYPVGLKREFPGEYLNKSLNEIKELLKRARGVDKDKLQRRRSYWSRLIVYSGRTNEGAMTNGYSANLLFRANVDDYSGTQPLCEGSLRVLVADSDEDARARAEQIGRAAQHSYLNEAGKEVRWVFVSVLELQDLCESALLDGMEVFSRLYREKGEDPE
jgi:hypothetical protein